MGVDSGFAVPVDRIFELTITALNCKDKYCCSFFCNYLSLIAQVFDANNLCFHTRLSSAATSLGTRCVEF